MKYCINCGEKLKEEAKFCTSCGEPIINVNNEKDTSQQNKHYPVSNQYQNIDDDKLKQINKTIELKNNQSSVVPKSTIIAIVGLAITILPFVENNPLTGIWALTMVGFFIFLTAIIVAFVFKSRAKKLQTLITGENLLASWVLNSTEKSEYVKYLYDNEKSKNKGIFFITSLLIVIIFGIFIAFINEGKAAMLLVMLILITLIAMFAFGMPNYYRSKNMNADGQVLIGKKFAYINGFFHNWDFPLSGIKKVSIINEPFYGLHLQYYYTDRTFTNTEELNIPAPQSIDLQSILKGLRNYN